MSTKNKPKTIHAQRFEKIRKFVDFKMSKNPTASEKRKIKKYFDEINLLTTRPFQIYRPRSAKNLKIAQDFAQHAQNMRGLKVAFIPTDGKNKVKISISRSGKMTTKSKHVTTEYIKLDTRKLLIDPKKHVESVIKKHKNAKTFSVSAGEFEIAQSHTRALIGDFVEKLTEKYSNEDANNFHGNWLHSLKGYNFEEQSDFEDYAIEKAKSKKELKKERDKKRAKIKRNKVDGRTTRHKRK